MPFLPETVDYSWHLWTKFDRFHHVGDIVPRVLLSFGYSCNILREGATIARSQSVLRGFFGIQDGVAGATDGYTRFDFFGARGAFGQRASVVEPRLFQAELTRGAALQISNEHGVLGALPFEIGGGDQAALKFREAAPGVGEFGLGGLRAGGDEHAVKASLP